MKQSFSNLRTPLDNPVAESFFSCLKREEFVHNYYDTIKELQHDIDEYVWQPEALDRDVPLTVYDVASEKAYYYHTDANKNVTELSHENRNVVAHYEYSPFGSLTKGTGDYASVNPFRKTSHDPIPEILLLYSAKRFAQEGKNSLLTSDRFAQTSCFNLIKTLYTFI